MNISEIAADSSRPCSRPIRCSIMSIGAVPPEEVQRLRSMENRRVLMATRGKASCIAARHSQCTLQS
ncbi:hypothetical protein D9M68_693990 [compost metagenome]